MNIGLIAHDAKKNPDAEFLYCVQIVLAFPVSAMLLTTNLTDIFRKTVEKNYSVHIACSNSAVRTFIIHSKGRTM